MKPLGVYRQPAADAHKWVARGVNLAVCYEPREATPVQWANAWIAAGVPQVMEPSGGSDDSASLLSAVLCPIQEADNAVVTATDQAVDAGRDVAAAKEAVYVSVEKWAAQQRKLTPHKPLAIILGLEQFRWGKADYVRLTNPFDYIYVDWYPIHRGEKVQTLLQLLSHFQAGCRLAGAFVECSAQHLDPAAYPKQRCPTADEFLTELDGITSLGLTPILFPQQIGEDGSGFQYDAMPDELVKALAGWVGPPANPATSTASGPLDGHVVTITIDGVVYTVQRASRP